MPTNLPIRADRASTGPSGRFSLVTCGKPGSSELPAFHGDASAARGIMIGLAISVAGYAIVFLAIVGA